LGKKRDVEKLEEYDGARTGLLKGGRRWGGRQELRQDKKRTRSLEKQGGEKTKTKTNKTAVKEYSEGGDCH